LGDVVCGGFAAPLAACRPRAGRHRQRLRLDLRDEPHRPRPSRPSRRTTTSAWAASSPTAARKTDEIDRFNEASASSDWRTSSISDVMRRSRLKKCTLFEMGDDPEIVAIQQEYLKLAEQLWAGTEELSANPMKDREIFDFLGFE
jgi:light-independent protochlorophyllide reductase subunit L